MTHGPSSHEAVFGCERCGAVWIDSATCQLLLDTEMSTESIDFIRRCDSLAAEEATPESPYRDDGACPTGACPVCDVQLIQTTLENGITIELCRSHGTVFDKLEVRRILFDRAAYTAAVEASEVRVRLRKRARLQQEAERLHDRRQRRVERIERRERKRRRQARRERRERR